MQVHRTCHRKLMYIHTYTLIHTCIIDWRNKTIHASDCGRKNKFVLLVKEGKFGDDVYPPWRSRLTCTILPSLRIRTRLTPYTYGLLRGQSSIKLVSPRIPRHGTFLHCKVAAAPATNTFSLTSIKSTNSI